MAWRIKNERLTEYPADDGPTGLVVNGSSVDDRILLTTLEGSITITPKIAQLLVELLAQKAIICIEEL